MLAPMQIDVISVTPSGFVMMQRDLAPLGYGTVLGHHAKWWRGVRYFHSYGSLHEIESVEPERRLGPISTFLAKALYNPRIRIRCKYRRIGNYRLEELRAAVAIAIEKDRNVLTRFEEAKVLLEMLAAAESFREIVAVLRRGLEKSA